MKFPEPPNINWYDQPSLPMDQMFKKFKLQHEEAMSAIKSRTARWQRIRKRPIKRKPVVVED